MWQQRFLGSNYFYRTIFKALQIVLSVYPCSFDLKIIFSIFFTVLQKVGVLSHISIIMITHTHTHTYICIYICVCVCVCVCVCATVIQQIQFFFFKNIKWIIFQNKHCLELVYSKIYINLAKIFLLRLFKRAANQRECARLEQRPVIKFLVAENYKQCEIYRRIGDVYGEECFSFSFRKSWKRRKTLQRMSKLYLK